MPLTKLDAAAALVVIDLQKGIISLPTAQPATEIVGRAAQLACAFRERGLPVVLVNVTGRAPGRTEAGFPKFSLPPDGAANCHRAIPNRQNCSYTACTMLHGWENFFMMAGTAAATLIGLLFVAITLGANLSTPQGMHGTRAFLTPTIFQFGAVLFQCLAVIVPWPSMWAVGTIMILCGVGGFVYHVAVILMQRRVQFASLDWIDFALFSAAPVLSHASLIAGAAGLIAGSSFAPYAIAGAITLLLLTGIRGAWVLTLWIASNRDKTRT